jgi:PAS domain S-box-containing protein
MNYPSAPAIDSQAIVVADAGGAIHLFSPGATTLFGYTTSEAVGERLDLIVPEGLRDRHWSGFNTR